MQLSMVEMGSKQHHDDEIAEDCLTKRNKVERERERDKIKMEKGIRLSLTSCILIKAI